MKIYLTASLGEATTPISAFDKALLNAGVSNYNLLILSSVIPPKSKIIEVPKYKTPVREYGHKLYCVRAEYRSEIRGEVIGAALGYYQLKDGRGVFVEHERTGTSIKTVEEQLHKDVQNSVFDLCSHRGFTIDKNQIKCKVSVAKVAKQPLCVLVLAVYQSEGWK